MQSLCPLHKTYERASNTLAYEWRQQIIRLNLTYLLVLRTRDADRSDFSHDTSCARSAQRWPRKTCTWTVEPSSGHLECVAWERPYRREACSNADRFAGRCTGGLLLKSGLAALVVVECGFGLIALVSKLIMALFRFQDNDQLSELMSSEKYDHSIGNESKNE